MKNTVNILVFIFIFFTLSGQNFKQLTNYNNAISKTKKEIVIERNNNIYRIVKNNSNHIEVWKFTGDDIKKVYVSYATICSDNFDNWSVYNDLTFYKTSTSNLSNYTETSKIEINSKLQINQDTFSYILNNELFLCENNNCIKIDYPITADATPKYFITPDKRYFGFVINKSGNNNQLFIYDRISKNYNSIKMSSLGISGYVRLDFIDNENLYFINISSSDNLVAFKYNIFDKKIASLFSPNKKLIYLTVNKKEIHLWDSDNKKVNIYDNNFNELENIDFEGLETFYIKDLFIRNDSTSTLFVSYKEYNSSDFDNAALIYNSEQRNFKKYLGCDEDLIIKSMVAKDKAIYCMIRNEDSGYQAYRLFFNDGSVGTPGLIKEISLNIFPNPTNDFLSIDKEIDGYRIYSIQGSVMLKSNTKSNKINIKSLPKGLYIIEIKNHKQRLKFVKI